MLMNVSRGILCPVASGIIGGGIPLSALFDTGPLKWSLGKLVENTLFEKISNNGNIMKVTMGTHYG